MNEPEAEGTPRPTAAVDAVTASEAGDGADAAVAAMAGDDSPAAEAADPDEITTDDDAPTGSEPTAQETPDDAGASFDGEDGAPGADDDIVMGEVIDIDAPPDAEPRPDETAARVASLEAQLKAVSAAYKAQLEEVEATKQRLTRQAAYKAERARGEVVGTFFEPVENLRRAIEVVRKAASEGAVGDDALSGLDLVLQQFMEAFRKLGVEEVSGKGARFDPNHHEALTTTPVTDPALDGVVVDVFDAGYRIGDTLLKPARVIVGALTDGESDA